MSLVAICWYLNVGYLASPLLPSKRRGDPIRAESLENLLASRLVIETTALFPPV
jgi:hypothetical protein